MRKRQRSVLPSWTVFGSLAVVAVAVLAFFITGSPDPTIAAVAQPSGQQPTPFTKNPAEQPKAEQPKAEKPRHKPKPAPPEREAYVEVYNNSGITGLADATSQRLQNVGWKVVGTDNWYGNIASNTVYFPSRLKSQADRLAKDIDVQRVRPAISPMRFDRLTVILTEQP